MMDAFDDKAVVMRDVARPVGKMGGTFGIGGTKSMLKTTGRHRKEGGGVGAQPRGAPPPPPCTAGPRTLEEQEEYF